MERYRSCPRRKRGTEGILVHASTTSDVSPEQNLAYPKANNNAQDEANLECPAHQKKAALVTTYQ